MPDSLVEQWLEWLRLDRGLADNTVRTYARTMRTFPAAPIANREDVEHWWRSRAENTAATRNNELAALRSFYKWCLVFEHRPDDPTARLTPPKQPKGLPHPISRADLNKLLEALDGDMRRAVALGAYAGLRVAEAAGLDWKDVDLELRRVRVTGKGGKTRLTGLSPLLLDSLLPVTGGNVVTAGQDAYSAAALQRKVNRAIQSTGVQATFHFLRHRYGTVAVASGVPLLSVSRAMGHSSPATTAIYAASSDADLDLIAQAVTR